MPHQYHGFDRNTKLFRELHDQVTDSLSGLRGELTGAEWAWFEFLNDQFRARYYDWPGDRSLSNYLTRLDTIASAWTSGWNGELLRLVGHVYLHIGLDLPRALADSFNRYLIPVDRATDIFLRPNDAIRGVFEQTCLQVRSAGKYALVARLLRATRPSASVVHLLGDRILLWRLHAFANGRFLADRQKRMTREDMLRRSFEQMSTAVMEASRNPLRWLDGLRPPWIVVDPFEGATGVSLEVRSTPGPTGHAPPERLRSSDYD